MAYILLPVLTLLLLAGGVLVGAGGGLLSTPKGACCKGCGGKKACCDVGEPRKLGWLRNIQAARIRAAIVVETETRHAPPTWRATAIAGDCQTPEASSATAIAPFDIRLALAGGLAGGVTNLVLYPLDTLKTMRQSDATIRNMKVSYPSHPPTTTVPIGTSAHACAPAHVCAPVPSLTTTTTATSMPHPPAAPDRMHS